MHTPLSFFFFNDTATTEIYTLSLHDALPIFFVASAAGTIHWSRTMAGRMAMPGGWVLSMRSEEHTLNSSYSQISYAVFCLKKKKSSNSRGICGCEEMRATENVECPTA